ncbi:sulfate permease [Spizellomyces punctatus DAOM BR117]|uniref:Sulfate permease n=1 Tax=Spizellomyces punctatus (strain DAOM BR117) TaxID=645134 RepID=A0A0L0HFP0_SPIPD|nr:sulfate permease [Spizellomyces punctatus DAOM BR117]KNC99588.1 sulfate permease [Spizellomyces punctatus DAOM BR117]|eukprot:XP_016607628.1 sulfate permease [Spizellomyces punctatus DAOM BR117]
MTYKASGPTKVQSRYPTQYQQFAQKAKNGLRHVPEYSVDYVRGLFPIASWLPRYNRDWLYGDLIAGLTVGIVVIPQALAYAKLATLPLQYGLYTSFTGVLIYALFATSKDVTIGATAVLSQLTGQVLATYNADKSMDPVTFAIAVSFLTGLIQLALGLFRLGIIVDFIPAPVIAGFTTGAGIGIIIGQFAGLLGIKGINTNDPAYQVLGNTLKALGQTQLDAAFGFAGLVSLLLFKFGCRYAVKRGYPFMKWVSLSRNAVVIIIFTAISYAINHQNRKSPRIRIVGDIPKGFGPIHVPDVSDLSKVAPASVTVVIVAILEHIAVVKSYGRLNGYRPDANQELVALGFTNFLGSFLGAYPATGSFSRSAIKSQSGVRSPLAALFTAAIVVLALYVLTPLFYYIPSAILSAIIISAISDLISRPALVKQLWDIQFLDLFAFLLALVFTFFFSIETGIYVSVGFAVAVLLYRLARPHYQVLARSNDTGIWVNVKDAQLGHTASPPPPGVLVFKLEESLTYPNANYFAEHIKEIMIESTEFGGPILKSNQKLWCDDTDDKIKRARKALAKKKAVSEQEIVPDIRLEIRDNDNSPSVTPPRKESVDSGSHSDETLTSLPRLRAVVFDFSAVNGIDSTGVQTLVDLRRDMDAFAGQRVEIHFAHVRPRFERILEYFLAITRTDRDVTPVVPTDIPIEETATNSNPPSSTDKNLVPFVDVRELFHATVDLAVAAIERRRSRASSFEKKQPEIDEIKVHS